MAYEHTKTLVESRADIVSTSGTGYSLLKHIYQFDSLRIHACGSETSNLQLNETPSATKSRPRTVVLRDVFGVKFPTSPRDN